MAAKKPNVVAQNSTEACEIIELTIGDLETLTRAFEVIKEVCEQRSGEEITPAFESGSYLEN